MLRGLSSVADSPPATPERIPVRHRQSNASGGQFQPATTDPEGPNGTGGPSGRIIENVRLRRLIQVLVTRGANGIVGRDRTGARAVSRSLARTILAAAAAMAAGVVVVAAPASAGAAGIVPPSNPSASVPPQVTPRCSTSPVDDTSAGCIDSVLHNINYARSLEGVGPLVLPSSYATDSVAMQELIITDEERGDRGLSEFTGLDPTLDSAALTGAQAHTDPSLPPGYLSGGAIFAQDYTPLGADYAWMYDDGYGGTNLDCTSPGSSGCWGHRDNILGDWTTTGSQTAMMGDASTSGGQYTEIFADQEDPADAARRRHLARHPAHSHDRRRARRGPGAAGLLTRHRGRHPRDHRGQLLRHVAPGVLRGHSRHRRPRELGRGAGCRTRRPIRPAPPRTRSS